jgi:ABC-2 type transport system permease protein
MNIIIIFLKEIKHIIRNRIYVIMLLLFPLILMVILGSAFANSFDNSTIFNNIDVLYLNADSSPGEPIFKNFIKTGSRLGIHFHQTGSIRQGTTEIANRKYAAFLYFGATDLKLYKNDHWIMKANLVEAVWNIFQQRYSAIMAISALNPGKSAGFDHHTAKQTFISETTLEHNRKARAIDFYAVTMLTMIILYSSYTAVYAIKREQLEHTGPRLLSTPIRNYEILSGKIFGVLSMCFLQILVIIFVSRYLFQVYWGDSPWTVASILMAETIMSTSIGIGLAFIIRNHLTINGILNLGIPILVFLGGGYTSVEGLGRRFLQFANLSPLRWTNKAIFEVIYAHDFHTVIPAILIPIGIALLFIGFTSNYALKEAH